MTVHTNVHGSLHDGAARMPLTRPDPSVCDHPSMRSRAMLQHEDLARAHLAQRLQEAEHQRLVRLAVARRRERRASSARRRVLLALAASR